MKMNKRLSGVFLEVSHEERAKMLDRMQRTLARISVGDDERNGFDNTIWGWIVDAAWDRLKIARAVSDAKVLRDTYHLLLGEIEEAEPKISELNDQIEDQVRSPLGDLLDNTPGCDYESSFLRSEWALSGSKHIESAFEIIEELIDENE